MTTGFGGDQMYVDAKPVAATPWDYRPGAVRVIDTLSK